MKNILFWGMFILFSCLFSAPVFAQTTLLSLIHEVEENEVRFWWKESTPKFADFDKELASSFRDTALSLVQPEKSVSRVYRTQELSDEKAKRISSLFSAAAVMHGKLELKVTGTIAGQEGVTANLGVTLISSGGVNTQVFTTTFFHQDPRQARIGAKREITKRLAQFVSWAVKEKNSAGVGYPILMTDLFLEKGSGRLIGKLEEQFELNDAKLVPLWASEAGIAFRVSGVDSNAIARIVGRAKSEEVDFEIGKKEQGVLVTGNK